MKLALLLRNPLFLLEEASEQPAGGGGTPAPAVTAPVDPGQSAPGQTPAAPAPAAPVTPAVPTAVSPGLGDRLLALASGKADLVAQNRELNGRVGSLTSQISALTGELEQARAQIAALETDNQSFRDAVAQLEAGQKTVEQGVTSELASLKVPRADLPAPAAPAAPGAVEQKTGEAFKAMSPAEKISAGLAAAWKKD